MDSAFQNLENGKRAVARPPPSAASRFGNPREREKTRFAQLLIRPESGRRRARDRG